VLARRMRLGPDSDAPPVTSVLRLTLRARAHGRRGRHCGFSPSSGALSFADVRRAAGCRAGRARWFAERRWAPRRSAQIARQPGPPPTCASCPARGNRRFRSLDRGVAMARRNFRAARDCMRPDPTSVPGALHLLQLKRGSSSRRAIPSCRKARRGCGEGCECGASVAELRANLSLRETDEARLIEAPGLRSGALENAAEVLKSFFSAAIFRGWEEPGTDADAPDSWSHRLSSQLLI
jgi:hypothetical protein